MKVSVRSVVIACTVAIAGCGGSATDNASSITASPSMSVDFTASLLDSSSITLSEQLAQQPVALWFWAPGWVTCNFEAPSVESAQRKFSGTVTVIGVAWNGSTEFMTEFVVRHGISFKNINDNNGKIFLQFGVPEQPAWVFIKQNGDTTTHIGAFDEVSLVSELQQLSES